VAGGCIFSARGRGGGEMIELVTEVGVVIEIDRLGLELSCGNVRI